MQSLKKKAPVSRSKVVKMPKKAAKKIVDPIGSILEKEIKARGMTVASWARQMNIPRGRIYKWDTSAPKYHDRLKIDAWLNGGTASDIQAQLAQIQAVNRALMNQVAKLMVKGTTRPVAEAMADLKADIELAKSESK